ncbi:MAG: hypothetical protein LBF38_06945 [Deltaproteobacteria bacterium]|nr:hypothetical protein [Deltaproteobacteria bacterium]
MSESKTKNINTTPNDDNDHPFDRQDYFKNIRNDFLSKIGLPPDTKPAQVMKILEIKRELALIQNRKKH